MRGFTFIVTVLLLATAWSGNAANYRLVQMAQPGMQTGQTLTPATLPPGVQAKDLGKAEDVRKTFDSFANAVLKKDNYKDVTDYFVESDRNRLGGAGNQNLDAWNGAIDQFYSAWKSKYNDNFTIKDRDQAYGDRFLSIAQGEVTNPEQVTHWPVAPMRENAEAFDKLTANPNLKKGTDIAVVTLQGTANEQPITVSLIREGSAWKIDLPDNVTADDLKASIARHLGEVANMKDQWPSDPNDAARVATYHILVACYSAGQGAGQTGAMPGMSHMGTTPGTPPTTPEGTTGAPSTKPESSGQTESQSSTPESSENK